MEVPSVQELVIDDGVAFCLSHGVLITAECENPSYRFLLSNQVCRGYSFYILGIYRISIPFIKPGMLHA